MYSGNGLAEKFHVVRTQLAADGCEQQVRGEVAKLYKWRLFHPYVSTALPHGDDHVRENNHLRHLGVQAKELEAKAASSEALEGKLEDEISAPVNELKWRAIWIGGLGLVGIVVIAATEAVGIHTDVVVETLGTMWAGGGLVDAVLRFHERSDRKKKWSVQKVLTKRQLQQAAEITQQRTLAEKNVRPDDLRCIEFSNALDEGHVDSRKIEQLPTETAENYRARVRIVGTAFDSSCRDIANELAPFRPSNPDELDDPSDITPELETNWLSYCEILANYLVIMAAADQWLDPYDLVHGDDNIVWGKDQVIQHSRHAIRHAERRLNAAFAIESRVGRELRPEELGQMGTDVGRQLTDGTSSSSFGPTAD